MGASPRHNTPSISKATVSKLDSHLSARERSGADGEGVEKAYEGLERLRERGGVASDGARGKGQKR
jgi:hypothetical protein